MITGNRISLRAINEDDTENIIKWRNSEAVRRNFINQELFTVESHLLWLENSVKPMKAVQFIIIDNENNMPVGSVFLRDIDVNHSKAEFGIFIGEEQARGKGFGAEATRLILKYGFEILKLNRIFLRVISTNIKAINSYKKSGFIEEGMLRQDVKLNNIYNDVILMGMLKSEGINL